MILEKSGLIQCSEIQVRMRIFQATLFFFSSISIQLKKFPVDHTLFGKWPVDCISVGGDTFFNIGLGNRVQ